MSQNIPDALEREAVSATSRFTSLLALLTSRSTPLFLVLAFAFVAAGLFLLPVVIPSLPHIAAPFAAIPHPWGCGSGSGPC